MPMTLAPPVSKETAAALNAFRIPVFEYISNVTRYGPGQNAASEN